MTGVRAFSAHLRLTFSYYCCGSLLRFDSSSTIAFQVHTGVTYCLGYIEDIYDDGGPLCPCSILKVAVNTIVPRSPFFAFCTPKYRLLQA